MVSLQLEYKIISVDVIHLILLTLFCLYLTECLSQ